MTQGYPEGWPRCACGQPALDGHLTCGDARCDERGARDAQVREPATDDEWREAAIAAEVLLRLDAARQYGLITGGPRIDADRCQDMIARARARGLVISEAEITAAVQEMVRALASASFPAMVRALAEPRT